MTEASPQVSWRRQHRQGPLLVRHPDHGLRSMELLVGENLVDRVHRAPEEVGLSRDASADSSRLFAARSRREARRSSLALAARRPADANR